MPLMGFVLGNVALVTYLLWYHYHVNNDVSWFYSTSFWGEAVIVVSCVLFAVGLVLGVPLAAIVSRRKS